MLEKNLTRNTGHPWDGRAGFDILELRADTQAEMDEAIKKAQKKFWNVWISGVEENTGKPGAFLYKPCDMDVPWNDEPSNPVAGRPRQDADHPT